MLFNFYYDTGIGQSGTLVRYIYSFPFYRLYVDCMERPYEGDVAMDREEAIKLWNISTRLVGDIAPISPYAFTEDPENEKWTYVGRKRRTAL